MTWHILIQIFWSIIFLVQRIEDHHCVKTFKEEYLAFLKKHKIGDEPNILGELTPGDLNIMSIIKTNSCDIGFRD